jgi:hypothetical protein
LPTIKNADRFRCKNTRAKVQDYSQQKQPAHQSKKLDHAKVQAHQQQNVQLFISSSYVGMLLYTFMQSACIKSKTKPKSKILP